MASKRCAWCNVSQTRVWRMFEETGKLDLCNGCGLQHAKGHTKEYTKARIKYARGNWQGKQPPIRGANWYDNKSIETFAFSNCTGLPYAYNRKTREAAKAGVKLNPVIIKLPKRRSRYRCANSPLKKHKEASPPTKHKDDPMPSFPPILSSSLPSKPSAPVHSPFSLEWSDLSPEVPRCMPPDTPEYHELIFDMPILDTMPVLPWLPGDDERLCVDPFPFPAFLSPYCS